MAFNAGYSALGMLRTCPEADALFSESGGAYMSVVDTYQAQCVEEDETRRAKNETSKQLAVLVFGLGVYLVLTLVQMIGGLWRKEGTSKIPEIAVVFGLIVLVSVIAIIISPSNTLPLVELFEDIFSFSIS